MKKVLLSLVSGLSILLMSCTQATISTDSVIKNSKTSNICDRINTLNSNGFFSSIHETSQVSRNITSSDEDQDISDANLFVSNPELYLEKNANPEEDKVGIQLVDTILNNGTIGSVSDIMYEISPEMSKEYLDTCESTINTINSSLGRSALSLNDIRDITLRIDYQPSNSSRAAFAANLNWDTIYWYYGMFGVTIAGLSAYKWCKWWKPWVGIAGLATAAAGGVAMSTQLGIWYSSTDLENWINGLANKKGAELTALANSSNGTKLLGISAATVGVVGFCYAFTPRVATLIVSKSISAWNKIIICITSVLPTGVTLVINGVKLKTI